VYPAYALSHTLFPRKISRKRTGIHFPALIAKKKKKPDFPHFAGGTTFWFKAFIALLQNFASEASLVSQCICLSGYFRFLRGRSRKYG